MAEVGNPAGPSIEQPGRVIAAKYELVRLLGEGGMGRVWLAHNLALDTEVAIKLIQPELLGRESTERLLQEARASARLKHPSVVRVFDFGTDEGQPFIVMEVLEGEPLSAVLDKRGRLPATNAVSLLLPVASALVAAHARGVVHRDLKPENVVLTTDERGRVLPKVVDFGVARLEPSARVTDVHKTQNGVVGTPDYMSPEQARGRRDVDARSDVWAFSVLLYESITGARPFQGDNYNALLTAICEDEPKSTLDHLAGDAELWAILSRGFEKDRERRWQSMRELGVALAAWATDRGLTTDATGGSLDHEWMNPRQSVLSLRPPSFTPTPSSQRTPRGGRESVQTLDGVQPTSESAPPPSTTPLALASQRPPTAAPAPSGSRLKLALAGAALLGVGAAFGWYALRPGPVAAPAAASASVQPPAPVAPQPQEPPPSARAERSAAPRADAASATATAAAAPPAVGGTKPNPPATGKPSAAPVAATAEPKASKPPAINDRPDF